MSTDALQPSKMTTDYVAWVLGDGTVDHFTAQLIRLIAKADVQNKERLRLAYPEAVAAYEQWMITPGGNLDRSMIFRP